MIEPVLSNISGSYSRTTEKAALEVLYMERNKRATDLADRPNLFLDPCSSAGFGAISLDRLHPDHTSHRAHTA